jgi:hypothetical protein
MPACSASTITWTRTELIDCPLSDLESRPSTRALLLMWCLQHRSLQLLSLIAHPGQQRHDSIQTSWLALHIWEELVAQNLRSRTRHNTAIKDSKDQDPEHEQRGEDNHQLDFAHVHPIGFQVLDDLCTTETIAQVATQLVPIVRCLGHNARS